MAQRRRQLGNFGEQAAAQFLARQGYMVCARQWRGAHGELDLVARDGEVFVFVEVRTRRNDTAEAAVESVGRAKQARLIALAHEYLEAHNLPLDAAWRIDIIAVDVAVSGYVARFNHIQHAVGEW